MRRNDGMTYSQRKRATMDYRAEYFRHNPGLFGCVWTCAYCHRPLLGAHNVSVDHILPLNSPLGRNTRFNLVAACRDCNLAKSDHVDYRVVKGYVSKMFDSVVFTIQKVVILIFVAIWWVIQQILHAVLSIFNNFPLIIKMIVVCIILVVLFRRVL